MTIRERNRILHGVDKLADKSAKVAFKSEEKDQPVHSIKSLLAGLDGLKGYSEVATSCNRLGLLTSEEKEVVGDHIKATRSALSHAVDEALTDERLRVRAAKSKKSS
ncbi:MAG: hypothetical protein M1484_04260 [Patescibacteria group bacterium]|nr:hypothetical protein [Patescibacteria group bacterium]MCL5432273.1 hypothetical protein [Patescibacteria group bacterium]